jgi:hypothetical protein
MAKAKTERIEKPKTKTPEVLPRVLKVGEVYRLSGVILLQKLIGKNQFIHYPAWTPFKVYECSNVAGVNNFKIGSVVDGKKPPADCGWITTGALAGRTFRTEVQINNWISRGAMDGEL